MRAWHFVGDTLRDGRPVPADGETLVYYGPVKICESGLHFSLDPFDALRYAPGPVLCEVEVDDVVETHNDKGVCRKRTIIRRIDMTAHLRRFACDEALRVLPAHAPTVVRQYLETADESLRDAARDAARVAAWEAARDAACAAAWDAAWEASRQRFNDMVNSVFAGGE